MIISHKYKFIFIKTLKTAGTSIEVFLAQHCGKDDIVTPIYPSMEQHVARNYQGFWNPLPELLTLHRSPRLVLRELYDRNKFWNHIPAQLVHARIPSRVWNSYFKFCVERNPWDKTLSHYSMATSRAGTPISLAEYFRKGNFPKNAHRYTDNSGKLLVDKVARYENLNAELQTIFGNLGVPFAGALTVKAKSEYRTDRRPYAEVLSPEQSGIIQQVFADEIAMHGYVFEEPRKFFANRSHPEGDRT